MPRHDKRPSVWKHSALLLATTAVLVCVAGAAHAALTSEVCLAKKLKEWGRLRKCQATEAGKAIQGKVADPAKCQAKFDARSTGSSHWTMTDLAAEPTMAWAVTFVDGSASVGLKESELYVRAVRSAL